MSQLPTSLSHCDSYSVPIFDLGGEGGNGIVAHRCLKPCQKVDISRTLPNKWVRKRNGRYLDCLEQTVPEAYFRVPSKFPISVPTRQVIYFVIFFVADFVVLDDTFKPLARSPLICFTAGDTWLIFFDQFLGTAGEGGYNCLLGIN